MDRGDLPKVTKANQPVHVREDKKVVRDSGPPLHMTRRSDAHKRLLQCLESLCLACLAAGVRASVDGAITVGVVISFFFAWGLSFFLIPVFANRRSRSRAGTAESRRVPPPRDTSLQNRDNSRKASGRRIMIGSVVVFIVCALLQTTGPIGMGMGFVGGLVAFGVFFFGLFRYLAARTSKA